MATADRVKETTTTTGTGDITLAGAVAQFQAFDTAFVAPATVSYAIVGQSGTEWEVGIGTLADATTLERTTVQASSNSNNAVNFSAGTKDVFATLTAAEIASFVVGPASATDDRIATFDGATGKLLQDGGSTVANVLARANHTGSQAISTVTDLQTTLDGKAATSHTHAAADITSGLAAVATSGSASDLSAGTLPDARFPATLPAASGVNLTALNATNLATGTLDDARLSSNVALENATNDFTAAQEISVNGAASTPALKIDGTIFTGGSATTTKPLFLAEPSTGTASTGWSTSGTLIGANANSGFIAGRLIDVQTNGVTMFYVNGSGVAVLASNFQGGGYVRASTTLEMGSFSDALFSREAAGTIQQGTDAAAPTAQTFKGPDARASTDSNTVGGIMNIAAGRGTGTAAGGELRLQTSAPTASGTAAGTLTTRVAISGTAITASLPIVTQGYTVAGLAAITPLVAGMRAHVTDATTPTFMATLVGGGAVVAPAFYDGTNWICA